MGVFDMKKTEMKNIIKTITAKHNITIINKSMFISDDNEKIICNGYKNETGECVEMYFNFITEQYSIQHLSSVCIHNERWFDM